MSFASSLQPIDQTSLTPPLNRPTLRGVIAKKNNNCFLIGIGIGIGVAPSPSSSTNQASFPASPRLLTSP